LFAMGFVTKSAEPKDRDAVSGAAAAVHRSGSGQRADAVAGAWIYPDRDQRQRQRADRTHRRIDRVVSRHAADMVIGAALADGHGARRPSHEDRVRGEAGVKAKPTQSS